jgi:hypothetical protein
MAECEGGTLPLSYAPLAWPWEGWAGQVLAYHGGNQVTGYRLQKQPGAGSWELGARSGGPAFVVSHICQQKADMGHPGFVVSTVE